jgi:hypothetical protein
MGLFFGAEEVTQKCVFRLLNDTLATLIIELNLDVWYENKPYQKVMGSNSSPTKKKFFVRLISDVLNIAYTNRQGKTSFKCEINF